jgi:rubrerythrin
MLQISTTVRITFKGVPMNHRAINAAFLAIAIMCSASFAQTVPKKTVDDLKAAFSGETTASAKYAAFAKKAKEEGSAQIALLFEAASKSEGIHAANHKAALEQLGEKAPVVDPKFEVRASKENLEDAIKGETYEVTTMYPGFIKDANKEKINIALISFNYAMQTEQRHKVLYENALKALVEKKVTSLPSQYQVCLTCGNTYDGSGPARCGICMTPSDRYATIK